MICYRLAAPHECERIERGEEVIYYCDRCMRVVIPDREHRLEIREERADTLLACRR